MDIHTFAPWRTMDALRRAALAARARTGDDAIGTQVASGRVDIVRVTYTPKGRGVVTVLQRCPNVGIALSALARMGA